MLVICPTEISLDTGGVKSTSTSYSVLWLLFENCCAATVVSALLLICILSCWFREINCGRMRELAQAFLYCLALQTATQSRATATLVLKQQRFWVCQRPPDISLTIPTSDPFYPFLICYEFEMIRNSDLCTQVWIYINRFLNAEVRFALHVH